MLWRGQPSLFTQIQSWVNCTEILTLTSSLPPADAVLQFDVELIALIRANYWQKLVKGILPLVGMAMVPALLILIGYHLYKKANRPKVSKKKLKEEKRNKSKKK